MIPETIIVTSAVIQQAGVDTGLYCKWVRENFAVFCTPIVNNANETAFMIQADGMDIWGALKDIHAHRSWVQLPDSPCSIKH